MTTISKTAFTRALSLASAHGHMWACHTNHPAVASLLAGPGPYDVAALTEAFGWAAAEDDSQFGGIGFALSHTTATGRLSWVVAANNESGEGRFAGDVDLTVSRPSLAWRVWSAQFKAARDLEATDPRVGAELSRMLPLEPERGSVDVLKVRIPADFHAPVPRWLVSPEVQDIGTRHLQVLAEAAHTLGGTMELGSLYALVRQLTPHLPADMLARSGVVMSQDINDNGRVITLDMWGQGHIDVHLFAASDDAPLSYEDTGIWTTGETRQEFLRDLATAPFMERLVDRLMSWAGMPLERACQTAELAIAEVGAPAVVRPIAAADGSWTVEVTRIEPAPTTGPIVSRRATVDELPVIFSSED